MLLVSGCGARTPFLQSDIDQAAAAREGRGYRGPGAGPEQTPEEYERATARRLVEHAPTPTGHPKNTTARVPDTVAISRSKQKLAEGLRDPLSAQFRNVRVTGNCYGVKYVTGSLNAKNGYGGYVGFTVFLVRIEGSATVIMQSSGRTFATDAEFRASALCQGTA